MSKGAFRPGREFCDLCVTFDNVWDGEGEIGTTFRCRDKMVGYLVFRTKSLVINTEVKMLKSIVIPLTLYYFELCVVRQTEEDKSGE